MGETEKAYFLRNLDIYSGLSEEEHIRIASSSYDCSKRDGELIYSPEKEDDNIYVLKKGEVELYHMKDGKKVVFDILTPGDVFGNFEINKPKPAHFASCSRSAYLCTTPLNDFLKIISVHPEIMLSFMQKMAHRIKDYEHKIEIGNSNSTDRIMYELERLKEKKSKNFFGKIFDLPIKITHEKLALITGLNRITVTRTLSTLQKEGKIIINESDSSIKIC